MPSKRIQGLTNKWIWFDTPTQMLITLHSPPIWRRWSPPSHCTPEKHLWVHTPLQQHCSWKQLHAPHLSASEYASCYLALTTARTPSQCVRICKLLVPSLDSSDDIISNCTHLPISASEYAVGFDSVLTPLSLHHHQNVHVDLSDAVVFHLAYGVYLTVVAVVRILSVRCYWPVTSYLVELLPSGLIVAVSDRLLRWLWLFSHITIVGLQMTRWVCTHHRWCCCISHGIVHFLGELFPPIHPIPLLVSVAHQKHRCSVTILYPFRKSVTFRTHWDPPLPMLLPCNTLHKTNLTHNQSNLGNHRWIYIHYPKHQRKMLLNAVTIRIHDHATGLTIVHMHLIKLSEGNWAKHHQLTETYHNLSSPLNASTTDPIF